MDGDLAFQYAKKERPRALPLFRFRSFADDQGVGFSAFVQNILQAAGLEFFVQSHKYFLLFVGQRENKTPSAKINLAEGDKIRGTTSVCRLFTETASRVRTPE